MIGTKKFVEGQSMADKPRVRHGATIEGVVGRTAPLVRMARLRAGWLVVFWPLVMAAMLFNIGRYGAENTSYADTVRG